jgi:hypothetical protein
MKLNLKIAIYVMTKIGMLYCMINSEWLALYGFIIATIYTYIDMVTYDT